jgi:hypothetical protein
MLIKSKVCFTVLVIYEIIAVSVLHIQRMCDAIFTTSFCDTWFRYFIFCVALPLIVMLIWMWIREIVHAHRRRRLIRRARQTVNNVLSSIRGNISENIDLQDMEKIIAAAVLVGIKKYAYRHPNIRQNVNHIMDIANGEVELDLMSTDSEIKPVRRRKTAVRRK